MNKKQQQAENILRHGLKLRRIYSQCTVEGPLNLCKALHRIEREGHRFGEQLCNGPEMTEAQEDAKTASILRRARAILGAGPEIFLNRDPRGYALKIDSEAAKSLDIEKDWGGYGIICPEF